MNVLTHIKGGKLATNHNQKPVVRTPRAARRRR